MVDEAQVERLAQRLDPEAWKMPPPALLVRYPGEPNATALDNAIIQANHMLRVGELVARQHRARDLASRLLQSRAA